MVSPEQCRDIIGRDPEIVHYPLPDGTVKLAKFTKKKLRPGTKLTIRVTKPGFIGKQFVILIRKNKAPKLTISQIA